MKQAFVHIAECDGRAFVAVFNRSRNLSVPATADGFMLVVSMLLPMPETLQISFCRVMAAFAEDPEVPALKRVLSAVTQGRLDRTFGELDALRLSSDESLRCRVSFRLGLIASGQLVNSPWESWIAVLARRAQLDLTLTMGPRSQRLALVLVNAEIKTRSGGYGALLAWAAFCEGDEWERARPALVEFYGDAAATHVDADRNNARLMASIRGAVVPTVSRLRTAAEPKALN